VEQQQCKTSNEPSSRASGERHAGELRYAVVAFGFAVWFVTANNSRHGTPGSSDRRTSSVTGVGLVLVFFPVLRPAAWRWLPKFLANRAETSTKID